jgi:hypothetical protein
MLLALGHTDAQHCTSRSECFQHLIYVVLLLLQAVHDYSSKRRAVATWQHQEKALEVIQADFTGLPRLMQPLKSQVGSTMLHRLICARMLGGTYPGAPPLVSSR